jgi:hypothetical protein
MKYGKVNCVAHCVIANFLPLVIFYLLRFNNTKGLRIVGYFSLENLCIMWAKSLHKALMEKAKEEGVSLNQLVVYLLSTGVEKRANSIKP